MYKTLIPGGRSGEVNNMCNTGSTAASVLPVAVGEKSRTFLPSNIFGIVLACGSVGAKKPFCSISLRTGLTRRSKTFGVFDASINESTFFFRAKT
jgi:hypothetical protein